MGCIVSGGGRKDGGGGRGDRAGWQGRQCNAAQRSPVQRSSGAEWFPQFAVLASFGSFSLTAAVSPGR